MQLRPEHINIMIITVNVSRYVECCQLNLNFCPGFLE